MDHSEVKHLPKVDHTPAELDTASKLLLAGAAYIETHGHAQNRPGKDGDKRCALCSLWEHGASWDVQWAAEKRLAVAVGGCISDFNNTHTTAEVIGKMRAVALGIV